MNSTDESRKHQRLTSFSMALEKLQEAKTVEVLIKKYYHPVLTRLHKTLNNQNSQ